MLGFESMRSLLRALLAMVFVLCRDTCRDGEARRGGVAAAVASSACARRVSIV